MLGGMDTPPDIQIDGPDTDGGYTIRMVDRGRPIVRRILPGRDESPADFRARIAYLAETLTRLTAGAPANPDAAGPSA